MTTVDVGVESSETAVVPVPWRQRLVDVVFPPTPNGSGLRPGVVVAYLVGIAAAVAYQILIPAGRSHLDHIWAEDGQEFLGGAANRSFPTVLFGVYSGYLHMVPRLGAEVVVMLPLSWWAAGMAVAAALVRAGVAALVYTVTAGFTQSRVVRLVLAAAVVVLPVTDNESLGNLANAHWFMLFAAFWALLWRPVGWGRNIVAAVVALLATVTSPLVIFLAPIGVARVLLPRRREQLTAIVFLIGAAVQSINLLLTPKAHEPFDLYQAVKAAGARVALVTFSGSEGASALFPRFGFGLVVAAVLVAAALAAMGLLFGDARRRVLIAFCLVAAVGFISVDLYLSWSGQLRVDQPGAVLALQRYSVVPCLFLFTAMVCGLDRLPRPARRYALAPISAVLVLIVALAIAYQMRVAGGRLDGPSWTDNIGVAKTACADGRPTYGIAQNPIGWGVLTLPCETILAS